NAFRKISATASIRRSPRATMTNARTLARPLDTDFPMKYGEWRKGWNANPRFHFLLSVLRSSEFSLQTVQSCVTRCKCRIAETSCVRNRAQHGENERKKSSPNYEIR